jgi:hypothetical protein
MAYVKKAAEPEMREYRALVNLSVGRVDRTVNGREERAERVEKGTTVYLTEQEAANYGRLVRLVEGEESTAIPRITPRMMVGTVNKTGVPTLEGSGALDMKNETRVISNATEADLDELAQPTKNPIDPSYRGEDA